MRERIKFYSRYDMTNGVMLEKCVPILRTLELTRKYTDINDILELYNVKKFIESKILRNSFSEKEKALFSYENIRLIDEIIGRFFSNFNDDCLIKLVDLIENSYLEDFFELVERLKVHKKISSKAFVDFIHADGVPLRYILAHHGLVETYDSAIRDLILENNDSINLLIDKYLRKDLEKTINLPTSLSNEDKEQIIKNYIQSEYVHIGVLEIISTLPIMSELKVSDEMRLLAKERHSKENEKLFSGSNNSGFTTKIGAQIDETQDTPFIKSYINGELSIRVSGKWICDNLDYPTLLNNFIYVYNFVDVENRIEFISKPNQASTLERVFTDNKLKNNYWKNYFFDVYNNFAILEMLSYCEYLENKCNIRIEDVIQWFFDKYLEEEFGVKEFIVNMPSAGGSYLEKCRTICCELESILKQYNIFVKSGKIDHNLLEISSKPMEFELVRSLMPNKYIYPNKNNPLCQNIMYWLFSDQTMLTYLPKRNFEKEYSSLFNLLVNEKVNISEYEEYQRKDIEMLIEKEIIKQDNDGNLCLYDPLAATVLLDLYINEFASTDFLVANKLDGALDCLKNKDLIYVQSSLFSKVECDYFDFYLNKSKFTNGQDLRNIYLHGTQRKRGSDGDLHKVNYYRLLMFVVITVIKINEELCYFDDIKIKEDNL